MSDITEKKSNTRVTVYVTDQQHREVELLQLRLRTEQDLWPDKSALFRAILSAALADFAANGRSATFVSYLLPAKEPT